MPERLSMTPISYMTDVVFAVGAVLELPAVLERHGISRPFIVTDHGVVAAGVSKAVFNVIGRAPVFDGTPANPTEEAVSWAISAFKAASANGIIALGGGSVIDLAKALALLATHPGSLSDYVAIANGGQRITSAVAPLIAVPTTSGSGSEVGRAALIVTNQRRKLALISPHLLPRCSICDPELTASMPPLLTAGSGMDAIAHCIETLLSPRFNPPAEAIALDGLRRAFLNIERAMQCPSDMQARSEMMMASLEGGLCFQKGLGAVHALSHALGALENPILHHGTVNGILLPAVLRFNADASPEKYVRIRSALQLPERSDLADLLSDLQRKLRLPIRLGELGVDRQMLPLLASVAMHDLSHATNPRSVTQEDYFELLSDSF
jgi:4-hydroxybutyrate dehydrogenase